MVTATSGVLYSLGIEEDLGYAMYSSITSVTFLIPFCQATVNASVVLEVQPPWCGERDGLLALEVHAELLSMENETSMD